MNQRNGRNSYKNVNQKNDKSTTEDDVGRNIVVVAFLLFDHIELGHETGSRASERTGSSMEVNSKV